ncbi:MAG TPA: glycosyltransferase family 39 protein [Acidimicrobiales bacterium]|nr:glycosyltransferase family 39 protein [Acidimicrobiales bacterium]
MEGIRAVEHAHLATVDADVRPDTPGAAVLPGQRAKPGPDPVIRPSLRRRLQFWRSPEGQPGWARPALLAITALAGLAYAWGINSAYLESFYGAAARSMAMSWHNFFFGAADPWGTVTVDKLPGALWFQALSLRIFGFHVWAIVLPQVIEGMLTVLVLYRVVRRVAGAGAGLLAAVIMAGSPVVILLDRGNISDSLLILLLVLAADAVTRAYTTGRLGPLLWAGVLVGFAFQTKMLQAWLVLPALYAAYLLAAPTASFLRRLRDVALSAAVTVVVSLSWMTAVTLVPASSRPYVDGSCDNSVFSQVFGYNGLARIGVSGVFSHAGCHAPSKWIVTLARFSTEHQISTAGVNTAWDRLLHGPFGHDGAWLLLPALVSAIAVIVVRRREPRTDPPRAAVVLWCTWLVVLFAFFSAGRLINSYYLAALVPAVAALCAFGARLAWQRRRSRAVRAGLAVTMLATVAAVIALVPGYVGVRVWIIASLVVVGGLAAGILFVSLVPRHASVWALTVGPVLAVLAILLGSAWASGLVVMEELGPFDSPYATAARDQVTRMAADEFPQLQTVLTQFTSRLRPDVSANTIETTLGASDDMLATGHEFLPVGGYTGEVSAPPLTQLIRYVAQGRVRLVNVATQPLTRSPDLLWVAAHCAKAGSYYYPDARVRFSDFTCDPADAKGPVRHAPIAAPFTGVSARRGSR